MALIRRFSALTFSFVCIAFLTGCATMQPSGSQQSFIESLPWKNYEDVNTVMKKIVVYKTTMEELGVFGFDSKSLPNTEIVKDVRERLLPRKFDSLEVLPPGAQACYRNFIECSGFRFSVEMSNFQGEGSVVLRLINVSRKDIITGWKSELDIYLLPRKYLPRKVIDKFINGYTEGDPRGEENVVVFMLLGGMPNVQQVSVKKNPLGFFDPMTGVGRKVSPFGAPNLNTD